MNELVSIIVPVYNVEKYIRKCIDSIIKQDYSNLEILLIDDGSTDTSGDICDYFGEIDERIQVIHKENGGLSSARNVGLDMCHGKYIIFVDSDDWVSDDYVGFLVVLLKQNKADISICGRIIVDKTNRYNKEYGQEKEYIYNNKEAMQKLMQDKEIHHYAWGKCYKREVFDGIRYPEGRNMEDMYTTYRTFQRANYIVQSEKQKYYYVLRESSIEGQRNKKLNWDQMGAYLSYARELMDKYLDIEDYVVSNIVTFGFSAYCTYLKEGIDGLIEKQQKEEVRKNILLYKEKFKKNVSCTIKYRIWLLLLQMNLFDICYKLSNRG